MATKLRIALVQLLVGASKAKNLDRASQFVSEAARNGAKMVALPEFFTCFPHPSVILGMQEKYPGPSTKAMMEMARQNNVFLIGGSIPITATEDGSKYYNTCFVYNSAGKLLARQEKLHMYDACLTPELDITESSITTPGSQFSPFQTDICKVGVGICMDLRYPELATIFKQLGCDLLVYPGSFTAKMTGPAHWDVLQRARAVDNQMYIVTVSPAENLNSPYISYGHSSVVNPWGEIIATSQEEEEIVYADIDMEFLQDIRKKMPIDKLRRNDLYRTENLTK